MSPPLFSIDKEKEPSAYKKEALRMIENLYQLIMLRERTKNGEPYEEYGLELVELARKCIENYDPASEPFLHYFNSALKKEFSHELGRRLINEMSGGFHYTEELKRNLRKYKKLTQSMDIDLKSPEFAGIVSNALGISIEKAEEIQMAAYQIPEPLSGSGDDNDDNYGENTEPSKESREKKVELATDILESESLDERIALIENAFVGLRPQARPVISMIISANLFKLLGDDSCLERVKTRSFFNTDIFEESVRLGRPMSQKEIAKLLGRSEQSISRTWNEFARKMQENAMERDK